MMRTHRHHSHPGDLALAALCALVALLGDIVLSRWLLEGARPEMLVAWILTGGWLLAAGFWLALLWLCSTILDPIAPRTYPDVKS